VKARRFVDSVRIHVTGGNGGHGAVSFRREKYVPRGGPDGGDGGRGGHIILRADPHEDSLIALHFAPECRAAHGGDGGRQRRHGRNGTDLVVRVPCGTEIRSADTGELLADLVEANAEFVAARGGKGGWGNCHWVSPTHQVPLEHSDGVAGETRRLRLELKLIADVGLVGFPNAGKSMLLGAVTPAHPKVAAYPFTTLHPMIGTLTLADYRKIRIADVPGLIRGAHAGAGLGDAFLRHIERASVLVIVIDMAGVDGRSPAEDYRSLMRELRLYSPELPRGVRLIVANKMDLSEAAPKLREFVRITRRKPIAVSALTGQGIEEFKAALVKLRFGASGRQRQSP
jgi:GTP-binding protein